MLNTAIVAHQQRVEERNSDYKRISSYFALPDTPAKNKGILTQPTYVVYYCTYNNNYCDS